MINQQKMLLTWLAGADIDGSIMWRIWAQFSHKVDCLNLKSILNTGQEVGHLHPAFGQPHLPGFKLNTVPTTDTRPWRAIRTHFTDNIEENILSTTQILWEAPGQEDIGSNNFIAEIPGGWWDAYKTVKNEILKNWNRKSLSLEQTK